MTKAQKIFSLVATGFMIFFGGIALSQHLYIGTLHPSSPTLGTTLPVAGTTYSISGSGIAPSDTSITLQSFTIPQTGQKIQQSDLSPIFYFTLEPGNNTKQEIVGCTTLTQNAAGTATVSNCSRGLSPISPYSASTTLQFAHAGGTRIILSDAPQLFNLYAAKANNELISGQWTASSTNPIAYDQVWGITASTTSVKIPYVSWIYNNFPNLFDNQTIAGLKTFSTLPQSSVVPATGNDLVNKTYADGLAIAGSPNASLTAKGISQEATVAQINAGTQAGSTGADLFVNPAQLQYTTYASSTFQGATTTTYAIATTSIPSFAQKDFLSLFFHATTTTPSGSATTLKLNFNSDTSAIYTYGIVTNNGTAVGGSQTNNATGITLSSPFGTAATVSISGQIQNLNGVNKAGNLHVVYGDGSAGAGTADIVFLYKSTTPITTISIGTTGSTLLATSTYMRVSTY